MQVVVGELWIGEQFSLLEWTLLRVAIYGYHATLRCLGYVA